MLVRFKKRGNSNTDKKKGQIDNKRSWPAADIIKRKLYLLLYNKYKCLHYIQKYEYQIISDQKYIIFSNKTKINYFRSNRRYYIEKAKL